MEGTVNSLEENRNRDNIIKGSKDYTTEDAITVKEKAMKAIKGKLCSDIVLHRIYDSQSRKSLKRLWIWQ